MIATVNIESREVASASAEKLRISAGFNEMRSALKDITMTENKMVVAVKKNFRTE
jgi:hypothetical protein